MNDQNKIIDYFFSLFSKKVIESYFVRIELMNNPIKMEMIISNLNCFDDNAKSIRSKFMRNLFIFLDLQIIGGKVQKPPSRVVELWEVDLVELPDVVVVEVVEIVSR